MGLFQGIVDFYDYKIPYYRWYIHRRIIFRDDVDRNKPRESLFASPENENFGLVLKKSVKIMLCTGGFVSAFEAFRLLGASRPYREIYVKNLFTIAIAGVVGAIYGTVLYSVANWREKVGPLNHMIASASSMPLFCVFAKDNRLAIGAILAVYPAFFAALLKLHADGSLDIGEFQISRGFTITENEYRRNQVIRRNPLDDKKEIVYGDSKRLYGVLKN